MGLCAPCRRHSEVTEVGLLSSVVRPVVSACGGVSLLKDESPPMLQSVSNRATMLQSVANRATRLIEIAAAPVCAVAHLHFFFLFLESSGKHLI